VGKRRVLGLGIAGKLLGGWGESRTAGRDPQRGTNLFLRHLGTTATNVEKSQRHRKKGRINVVQSLENKGKVAKRTTLRLIENGVRQTGKKKNALFPRDSECAENRR